MEHPWFLSLFSGHSRPPPKPDDSIRYKRNTEKEEILAEEKLLHPSCPMSELSPLDVITLNHKGSLQNNPLHSSSLRQPRRSFSGFSHAIEGLRCLPRKSNSRKQSGQSTDAEISPYGLSSGHIEKLDNQHYVMPKYSVWLQRHVSTTFRHHRRPHVTPSNASESCVKAGPFSSPIPSDGIQPPRIPDNPMSGAAARAAAATQNELLESIRTSGTVDSKLSRDSESGIGIELRDRIEDSEDVAIRRKDFVKALPEELVVQIFFFLDAASIISAELVSKDWHRSATSHHVWKNVFRNEYNYRYHVDSGKTTKRQLGAAGLGRRVPDQDWKRMWKARKTLQQRWKKGYAAAVYLNGHTDSVYCVQFDEHKILTGSRDRTVRVWDAHTYQCVRVLGVPSRTMNIVVPPLPSITSGRGQRPFKTVFSHETLAEPTDTSPSLFHDGSILCLQYNDDVLVTGSSDCTCIVWDIKRGYLPTKRLHHHVAGVLDVCFDDKHIVSCSKDTTICLWDQRTGEFLRKLNGHRGPVNAVQLRGDLLVSASGDGVAKLWNIASGLCIKEFLSRDRGMACVEFSLDARTILAGGNDQVIYQFDTNTGEIVRELNGHRGLVRSLHLDSANERVVSGSYDTSVKAYELGTGENIVDFAGWTSSWILSAKADYRRIVATSQDSRTVIMDFGYELPDVELLEA